MSLRGYIYNYVLGYAKGHGLDIYDFEVIAWAEHEAESLEDAVREYIDKQVEWLNPPPGLAEAKKEAA